MEGEAYASPDPIVRVAEYAWLVQMNQRRREDGGMIGKRKFGVLAMSETKLGGRGEWGSLVWLEEGSRGVDQVWTHEVVVLLFSDRLERYHST